jgi:hypothetical protein
VGAYGFGVWLQPGTNIWQAVPIIQHYGVFGNNASGIDAKIVSKQRGYDRE